MTARPRFNPSLGVSRLALFMEHLSVLPLLEWHERAMTTPHDLAPDLESGLTVALEAAATVFEIWCAKDNVTTALFRFECAEGRIIARPPGTLAHIRRVTERAALATLAWHELSTKDFEALCGRLLDLS